MSFQHHGDNPFEQEQSRLIERLKQQQEGMAKREYPNGRLNASDDGEVAFKIGGDGERGVVVIDFGKPVTWVGMTPQQAVEMAQLMIKNAREVSKEPLRVVIG
ncbi:hypothetical protein VT03_21245 [Planctomyces sp. SH-PL14]|nr:hypothetical protein VT03_21245 [Planctomyces sp. SH-PL14]